MPEKGIKMCTVLRLVFIPERSRRCLIKGQSQLCTCIFTPGNKNSWLLQLHLNIYFKVAFCLKLENIFRTKKIMFAPFFLNSKY